MSSQQNNLNSHSLISGCDLSSSTPHRASTGPWNKLPGTCKGAQMPSCKEEKYVGFAERFWWGEVCIVWFFCCIFCCLFSVLFLFGFGVYFFLFLLFVWFFCFGFLCVCVCCCFSFPQTLSLLQLSQYHLKGKRQSLILTVKHKNSAASFYSSGVIS